MLNIFLNLQYTVESVFYCFLTSPWWQDGKKPRRQEIRRLDTPIYIIKDTGRHDFEPSLLKVLWEVFLRVI